MKGFEFVREVLAKPKIAGRKLSPYLVKSLSTYLPVNTTVSVSVPSGQDHSKTDYKPARWKPGVGAIGTSFENHHKRNKGKFAKKEEECPHCKSIMARSENGKCNFCGEDWPLPDAETKKMSGKFEDDPCPPCPKCKSSNTHHARTDGSGNAICADCKKIFTDPEYGKTKTEDKNMTKAAKAKTMTREVKAAPQFDEFLDDNDGTQEEVIVPEIEGDAGTEFTPGDEAMNAEMDTDAEIVGEEGDVNDLRDKYAEAPPAPVEEKYGAKVIRRVHKDYQVLLRDYHQMIELLEESGVSDFVRTVLSQITHEMSEVEALFDTVYSEMGYPDLEGRAPREEVLDEALDETEMEQGDEIDPDLEDDAEQLAEDADVEEVEDDDEEIPEEASEAEAEEDEREETEADSDSGDEQDEVTEEEVVEGMGIKNMKDINDLRKHYARKSGDRIVPQKINVPDPKIRTQEDLDRRQAARELAAKAQREKNKGPVKGKISRGDASSTSYHGTSESHTKRMCQSCGKQPCLCGSKKDMVHSSGDETIKQVEDQANIQAPKLKKEHYGPVGEAGAFLSEIGKDKSVFDREHQLKAYHYGKTLEGIHQVYASADSETKEMDGDGFEVKDMECGGGMEMETKAWHKCLSDASSFMIKDLANTKSFGNGHREKCMSHYKSLSDLIKDKEETEDEKEVEKEGGKEEEKQEKESEDSVEIGKVETKDSDSVEDEIKSLKEERKKQEQIMKDLEAKMSRILL